MSTQQQMNKPQSPTSVKATPPNNKRKSPSQARLDKLKKLKENNETKKSHDLTGSKKLASPNVTKYELDMPPELMDLDTTVSLKKRRNGEFLPHVHVTEDTRKKTQCKIISIIFIKNQVIKS